MADAEKTLKLLIEMGFLGRADAEAANQLLTEAKENTASLAKEMGVLTVTQEDVDKATRKTSDAVEEQGKNVEEAGHHAGNARLQHMALHHAFTELDKICPGLGNSLNMITRGMHSMGDGAEGAQGKIAALLDTVGPLIVVMLSIQLATKVWEDYEEKLGEIQKKQIELTKSTEEETGKMVAAISRLDKAMHPEKTEADDDKAKLEKQKQAIEDAAKEQSAKNKFSEEQELAKATTPEEKTAIKDKFKKQEADLEDWKLGELSRVTNTMAAAMQKRAEQIQHESWSSASSPEEKAAFAQAQGRDATGKSLQMHLDAALYKQAGWDAATGDLTMIGRGTKSYLGMGGIESAEVEAARKALAEHQEEGNKKLAEIRAKIEKKIEVGVGVAEEGGKIKTEGDKLSHDASESKRVHQFERGVPDTSYRATEGAFKPAGTTVDINGLIAALHLNEKQKNIVLDRIHNVTHDSLAAWNALERKWQELEQQVRNSRNRASG